MIWNGVTNAKKLSLSLHSVIGSKYVILLNHSGRGALFSTAAWWVALLFSLYLTDASFAMDTKCEIKSSCSLSRCQKHTDPMTVDPGSKINLNCTIITGGLALDMTWRQALKRVKSSTGSSKLVLEQSNSTNSGGKYSCGCTSIKFARKCFLIQPWYQFKTIKRILTQRGIQDFSRRGVGR